MLLVKTKIGPSSISGIGLFADEFLVKGTPVWKLQPGFDIKISQREFKNLSLPAQSQVLNYCYVEPTEDAYTLCGDDARFFNHSDEPNVSSGLGDGHIDAALRDIQPGEELTQNYGNFDAHTALKLHLN